MERRQKEPSHCLFLFLAQLFFFHLYRSRLLQATAWWHEPGFALDSYKRQLSSWELHALRCGNNTVRWPDKDLQMESEEVADAPALFSKWKSAPERRGHVLRSLFLSSPFFFSFSLYRVLHLTCYLQREDNVADLWYWCEGKNVFFCLV